MKTAKGMGPRLLSGIIVFVDVLMCSSLIPSAMMVANFAPTSPRNVPLMISRVLSCIYLSDALFAPAAITI